MSNDENLFWELVEKRDAVLTVDNDSCYVSYDYNDEDEPKSESFDFSPTELVFMMAERLEIEAEHV